MDTWAVRHVRRLRTATVTTRCPKLPEILQLSAVDTVRWYLVHYRWTIHYAKLQLKRIALLVKNWIFFFMAKYAQNLASKLNSGWNEGYFIAYLAYRRPNLVVAVCNLLQRQGQFVLRCDEQSGYHTAMLDLRWPLFVPLIGNATLFILFSVWKIGTVRNYRKITYPMSLWKTYYIIKAWCNFTLKMIYFLTLVNVWYSSSPSNLLFPWLAYFRLPLREKMRNVYWSDVVANLRLVIVYLL